MAVKVSICIPAYEQTEFLRKNLDSVMQQSFQDFEVIITDDSRSKSVEQLVKKSYQDPRIHYTRSQTQLGSPQNWNAAIGLAKGEYIKILHHDDWLTGHDSLGGMVKLLDENPKADLAFCASNVCGTDGQIQNVHTLSNQQISKLRCDYSLLLIGNLIGAPSATIYRRSAHQAFDTKLRWVVDIEFYLRLLRQNPNFAYSPSPLISTTNGAAHQLTGQLNDSREVELYEWFYIFDRYLDSKLRNNDERRFLVNLLARYDVNALSDVKDIKLSTGSQRLIEQLLAPAKPSGISTAIRKVLRGK